MHAIMRPFKFGALPSRNFFPSRKEFPLRKQAAHIVLEKYMREVDYRVFLLQSSCNIHRTAKLAAEV